MIKMTEKRYEKRMNFNINLPSKRCFKSDEAIVDKKEDPYEALSINTIVDLLNALHEENTKLKEEIKFETRINNGKRFEASDRIVIDNQTKLHYICTLDWEVSLIVRLLNKQHETITRLEKENEQLKERLKLNCPNIVWRDLE